MGHENRSMRKLTCFIWGLLLAGMWIGVAAAVAPFEDKESDGYLQWLHSLEQTTQAREEVEAPEGNLLFPFNRPGWDTTEDKPYRHLAISKAIMELEAQWLLRGGNREKSALVALSHARNYTNLSEYDSALVWYQAAADLDTLRLFQREIGWENMAASAASGDSLNLAQLITNTMGSSDLQGREQELVLAFRWLLTTLDSDSLKLLLKKVESQPELVSGEIKFWTAYSQSWLGSYDQCLHNLRGIIKNGGLSEGLTEGQRQWVLSAIPDLYFLLGDSEQSRSLYEVLLLSSLDNLQLWARYQLGNLAFLEADYKTASGAYGVVCEAKRMGSWQDNACEMATLATELNRIKKQGEPYGTASFYNP